MINGVLLRTLPVRHPEDLIVAYWKADEGLRASTMNNIDRKEPGTGQWIHSPFPLIALREFRKTSSDILDVFGFYNPGKVGFNDGATTYAAHCTLVTGNFFEGLGARMVLGRPLTEADDQPGTTAAMITYDFWQRPLQGDASVLGKVMRVNGAPITIVGVSAPGFHGIASAGWGGPTEVFLPFGVLDNVLPREFRFGKPKTAPDFWWVQMQRRSPRSASPCSPAGRQSSGAGRSRWVR